MRMESDSMERSRFPTTFIGEHIIHFNIGEHRMPPDLQRCGKAVETALDTYALISQQAVALNSKSGNSHLEDLDGGLRLFKRLAELDFV